MVFGLNEDKKKATKPADAKSSDAKKNDDKSNGNKDEAQELLKKMQEKEDQGDCAFC